MAPACNIPVHNKTNDIMESTGMAIPLSTLIWFAITVVFQTIGVALLPATRGMTAPAPVAGAVICYGIGIYAMARLLVSGIDLSLLIPIMTVVMLASLVAVGVVIYGEGASLVKLGCLAGATMLIGLASRY